MLHFFWLSLFGAFIGVFGTLIGVGGGVILTPALLLLYPRDSPDTITSISLAVTFANAFSGSVAYSRLKRINYRCGLIFSFAAIPGAVLGAMGTYYIPTRTFTLIFAVFLIIASFIIFAKKNAETNGSECDSSLLLSSDKMILGMGISIVVGFISSFLGVGGGIIHVPVLSQVLGFSVHNATATSQFILAITTFMGVVVHIINGSFHHGIRRIIALAAGVLIGAQVGAMISSRVKGRVIMRILSVVILLAGIRLMVQSLIER